MSTYSLEGLADFILQLYDKDSEDEIWQTWLHKEQTDNFKDFKKKYLKKLHKPKNKVMSIEEEQKAISNAVRFIKPVNKGGEN
ncbi:hypothetical protein [Desemzia sp. FAM 23989]|uniref:hypothetical protein n=1 Tax=Desemzia sp. FAM 23989 TaxID=3259523 RepID=UPI00388945B2